VYTLQVKWIVLKHTAQLCLMQLSAKFDGNFKLMVKDLWFTSLLSQCVLFVL